MSVYLHLFHGRTSPEQDMEDWGTNGPTIGPLDYVHTTYANHIKLGTEDPKVCERFGLDPNFPELQVSEGLVVWDGKYYGDWSVSTEIATGFYQLDDGPTLDLTHHAALEHFQHTPSAKKLFDVGSSEPVLVKERT